MKTKSNKTAKKTKITDKKLNISVVIKSCHEDSEDQFCGRGYPRNDKGCKGCPDWF